MSKTPASNTEQDNDITQGPFLGSESYDTGSSTGLLTTCSRVCCYHRVQEYRKGNHAEKAGDITVQMDKYWTELHTLTSKPNHINTVHTHHKYKPYAKTQGEETAPNWLNTTTNKPHSKLQAFTGKRKDKQSHKHPTFKNTPRSYQTYFPSPLWLCPPFWSSPPQRNLWFLVHIIWSCNQHKSENGEKIQIYCLIVMKCNKTLSLCCWWWWYK